MKNIAKAWQEKGKRKKRKKKQKSKRHEACCRKFVYKHDSDRSNLVLIRKKENCDSSLNFVDHKCIIGKGWDAWSRMFT